VLPYSSITMAMCAPSCCISRNRSFTGLVSGYRANGACQFFHKAPMPILLVQLEHVANVHEAVIVIDAPLVNRNARIALFNHKLA